MSKKNKPVLKELLSIQKSKDIIAALNDRPYYRPASVATIDRPPSLLSTEPRPYYQR